jgi:hypothetical protein
VALIPVHTRRSVPADLARIIENLPPGWTDDGLSGFPDSVLGFDISPAGTGHDALYCSRLWGAGELDRNWREAADGLLGRWVRALLPFGLRWTGWLVFAAVYELGGAKAFDSCGKRAYNANAGQIAAGLCRHGVPRPPWMIQQ